MDAGERKKNWLQRLIAQGLMMGISKRELLCDYYPDELATVFGAWSDLHAPPGQRDAEPVSAEAFLEL